MQDTKNSKKVDKQISGKTHSVDLSSVVGNRGLLKAQEAGLKALKENNLIYTETGFQIPRIKSGVQGLDELIEGGIPEKSLILLTGGSGTGKSTFAMNFLVHGAMNNEPGLYVSLEEAIEENLIRMKIFGWPIEKLIKENKLMLTQPELYDFDKLLTNIEDSVTNIGAKRLVIDSITLLNMYFKDPFKVRRSLLTMEKSLKSLDCTTLAISEVEELEHGMRMGGVEEYLADGVIILYYIKKENAYSRAALIRKMRATNHSLKVHPLQIKRPGGVVIYPEEEVFTEL